MAKYIALLISACLLVSAKFSPLHEEEYKGLYGEVIRDLRFDEVSTSLVSVDSQQDVQSIDSSL